MTDLDAAAQLGLTFSSEVGTPEVNEDTLSGWMADTSQSMHVNMHMYAVMVPESPVVAPPSGSVFVKRVSEVFEAPVLNAYGRPKNWQPTGVEREDWGRLRVLFNHIDVTYYRGIPVQVKEWADREPFRWAHAEISFPQIAPFEPLPDWLSDWADVDIRLVRPDGTEKNLWLGLFADEEDSLSETGSGLTVQLIGALYQADLYQMPPAITPRELEVYDSGTSENDIGAIIYKELDPSRRPNLRTLPPTGRPFIGRRVKLSGSWDALLTGYIQGLLDMTTYVDPEGIARQWTVQMVGRRPKMMIKWRESAAWTMRVGQPGLTHSLSRDFSMVPNVIYGEGTDPEQCQWRNTKYPNLRTDDAPIFPGTVLAPGHSGDGVGDYEQELYNNGWALTVDDYYDPEEQGVVENFQASAGIQVDGEVGPQTWAAIFETGSNSGDLTGSFFMPLVVDNRVEKHLYNASGGIIGDQPAFEPGRVRVERFENFGSYVRKAEATESAISEISRDGGPAGVAGYFGTLELKTDPIEGSRFEIEAGDNFMLEGHRGVDRLMHIAGVDVNWESQSVSLTVDERARDHATLASTIDRERDNLDPAKRKTRQYRNSQKVEDRRAIWDCENGSGVIPRHATYSGLWNVLRIPAGELGTVVRSEFTVDEPAQFSVAVFDQPTTHSVLTSHGSPMDSGYWDTFPEDTGLIVAWGGDGQMGGYYPTTQGSDEEELTGRLVDDAAWYFQTKFPPWLWVAIWVESPTINYIQGRFTAGVND